MSEKYKLFSVVQLRNDLRRRKLKISGKKKELIERLVKDDFALKSNPIKSFLVRLTVKELKDILREHNLKMSGKKEELVQRLEENNVIRVNDKNQRTLEFYGIKPPVFKERKRKNVKEKRQTKIHTYFSVKK